jgi:autotransporter-associated beta strand protein
MLMNPSAMIGGNIDLGSNDRSLWLQSGAGTYTFGLGGNPGAVSFRNAGQGGLRLFDGSVTLDPGNGGDYSLGATANARIRLARQLNTNGNTPFQLTLGNSASYLTLGSQNFAVGMAEAGGNGNDPRHTPVVRMDFALSDAGTARNLLVGEGGNSYSYVLRLTRDAGGVGANLGGSTITSNGGWVSVDGMNRLFNGGLDLGSGGVVLDGVSWSAFAADRSGGFTTGTPGAGQWRLNGGGLAARGSTVVIDATGTSASTFDRNFQLGTAVMNTDGTYYANATVEIARDTTLTGTRSLTVGGNGKGLAGSFGTFQEISGNLSGAGALSVAGEAFALTSANWTGELVLSGANSWTGGLSYSDGGRFINLGAGGLAVQRAYVRFDGQGSLPTGNGGNPALLGVLDRNNGARGGFLLTGHGTETAYNLPTGYRFLFGGVNSGDNQGVFGSDGGLAKLEDSTILIHYSDSGSASQTLSLLTREGSVLTLGGTAGPTRLVPSRGQDLASAPTTATTVTDSSGTRTLVKRGEGTLVLEDVAYTDVAESGNKASQFVWQIGRASGGNSGSGAYFDGAVRETGTGTSDSLSGFNVQLAGGVLETSGLFNRATGTGATQVQWNNAGGGGFSAHGGALTVNLGGAALGQTWGSAPFVRTNESLIFGSYTANDVVTFQNPINLNSAVREVRVIDNPGSGSDKAVLSGALTGTGVSGLTKTGTGRLDLGGNNTYAGATTVSAGTLALTGGTQTGSSYVVSSGASFLQTAGTWVLAANANNLFHINGSGGTVQVADLADSSDGTAVLRFTLDAGGVSTLQLTDATPFAQYGGSAAAWAAEWTLDLNTVSGLEQEAFPSSVGLIGSTAYNLTNLDGLMTLRAWDAGGSPFTYNNLADGQKVYVSSGVALAEYSVSFTANGFDLVFEGSRAIPEPGTLGLIGLALVFLRRSLRRFRE